MTVPNLRPAARRTPAWLLWAAAMISVVASLAAIALPGPARADSTGYDQITGIGSTASAVTVPWTQGLLDNTNTPIASANADRTSTSPTSPLSFMYGDFKNLSVTVSQTQDISHQGVTVSWTGGLAGPAGYLQMMECYGDASTGPTPEQCEYGSSGLLQGSDPAGIGTRTGDLCTAGAVPSTSNPPSSANGSTPGAGCDPLEPSAPDHLQPCPTATPNCPQVSYTIPFAPADDPTSLDYNTYTDSTWFSKFTTDEIQKAPSNPSGGGQQQFETLTATQAPGLGCGEAETDGSARGCWLVIVPRGQFDPNGYQAQHRNSSDVLRSSPLSAGNWAQRIQIHLAFAPVGSFCPPDTLERPTFGTQLAARAMQSWQLALNAAAKCSKVYAYSSTFESTSTTNLEAGGDSGLAFTTIPIGSEAARGGGTAPANLPNILYAPVAITSLDFGFNIFFSNTIITTPVKLTPLLVAKALTQSYRQDLPDYYPEGSKPGPAWSQGNPLNISLDPQFQALNPTVPGIQQGPVAPLITEDHSAQNQQIWQYVQSDSAATAWLGGTPDTSDGNNMQLDPAYQSLKLGQAPALDSFPRAYNTCLDLGTFTLAGQPDKEENKCTLDLIPYTENYDAAAAAVLTANNPDALNWDPSIFGPDNTLGWWDKEGIEPSNSIWMWGMSDTSHLAAYGVISAQLCPDESGNNCISPSISSLTAAVNAAKPDSAGLLQVDPANPGTGGYPLTQIIYAAVPTNQSAAALNDYADLIADAAGAGQTPGASPGDLPAGYLPLTSSLVSQAQAVVTQLRSLASPSPSASASASPTDTSSSAASTSDTQSPATTATTAGSSTGGTGTGTAGTVGGATPAPTPAATAPAAQATSPVSGLATVPVSSSHSAAGAAATSGSPVISLPPEQAAAGTTPQQAVGAIRWVLIGVAVAGGGFAGGGALLRSSGLPPWLRRRLE